MKKNPNVNQKTTKWHIDTHIEKNVGGGRERAEKESVNHREKE